MLDPCVRSPTTGVLGLTDWEWAYAQPPAMPVAMSTDSVLGLYTYVVAAFVLLLMVAAPWVLWRRLRAGELQAGGSLGRQWTETLLGRRDGPGAYGATISRRGTPVEHVVVLSQSRREATRSLKAAYGKRNVSNVHAEDERGRTDGGNTSG